MKTDTIMKKHVIDSLFNDSYVCLKPSKVSNGVGVFALRDIPANTYLFYDMTPDTDFIPWDYVNNLHPNVIEYLRTVCIHNDVGFYLSRTYNNLSFAHFIQKSNHPNVEYIYDSRRWKTKEAVSEGVEITSMLLVE